MIPVEIWIVWAVIGIVVGYMCSRLLLDGCHTFLLGVVGVAGSLLGGWTLMSLLNVAPEQFAKWLYVSLLTAAALSGICAWVAVVFLRSKADSEDSEE